MDFPVSPLMRLEHVSLRVSDLQESLAWYCDIIGLAEVSRSDTHVFLAVGNKPTWDLALTEGGTGLEYFACSINDDDELAALADRLTTAGVDVETLDELDPLISAGIEFRLPGGHRMRVVVPEGRTNYTVASEKTFGALNSIKEIHHVNLAVTDIPALEEFVVSNLGFAISDHVHAEKDGPLRLAFWRIAENHHDLGAVVAPTDGLHHYAFVVSGIGHLVQIADSLASKGYWVVENGISRHGCGNNLFLYVKDPTGNIVEFSGDIARIVDRGAPYRVWTTPARAGNAWGPVEPVEGFLETVT
jgi:catechol 2,3-dioxygenase